MANQLVSTKDRKLTKDAVLLIMDKCLLADLNAAMYCCKLWHELARKSFNCRSVILHNANNNPMELFIMHQNLREFKQMLPRFLADTPKVVVVSDDWQGI